MALKGRQRHKLKNININTKTAICSVCGPTEVRFKYCNKSLIDRPHCIIALKEAKRKEKYGVSAIKFNSLIGEQKFKCLICESIIDRTAHVDHCHTTKKVRGILCFNCNIGLGHFKNSIDNLKAAILYLQSKTPSQD